MNISPDIINALIGIILSAAQALNLYKLHDDWDLKGVSLTSCSIFTIYGLWAIYYYNSLNQQYSFYISMVSGLFVTAYLALAIFIRYFKSPK